MRQNLGELVGRLEQELDGYREGYLDIDAFNAPGECHQLLGAGHRRDLERFFRKLGIDPVEFIREVGERTSPRWAYWRGLHEVFEILERT